MKNGNFSTVFSTLYARDPSELQIELIETIFPSTRTQQIGNFQGVEANQVIELRIPGGCAFSGQSLSDLENY